MFNLKDKIMKYGWMALAILAITLLVGQSWRLHVSQLAEAKAITTLANERAAAAQANTTQIGAIRKIENSMEVTASETRKTTNAQVSSLNVRSDSLLQRVRNAAVSAKPAEVPSTSAVAGDGQAAGRDPQPELLGQFGEEDVREAKRGDTIRLHLQACYALYDRAQEALNKLGKTE